MRSADRPSPLHRYFAGLAEHTFHIQLGVADGPLVSYVADLLTRFLRTDTVYKVRDLAGKRADDIVTMLTEAEARIGDARREVHRHVGDFTLFWLGVYPESIERDRGSTDRASLYMEMGKRSYYIASTIVCDDEEKAPSDLLERLSHRFELCAFGLREVRREWETRGDGLPDGLFLN